MRVRSIARQCIAASTRLAQTVQPATGQSPWNTKCSLTPQLSLHSRRSFRSSLVLPRCMAPNTHHAELDTLESVVDRLHSCSTKLVMYVTGGGSQVRQISIDDVFVWVSSCTNRVRLLETDGADMS